MAETPTLRDLAQAGAAVAGRGLMLKLGAVALLVFILAVMLLGALAGAGTSTNREAAAAENCLALGPSVSGVSVTDESEQIAQTAADVATQMRMPGMAVLVILMTGYQESTMRNLDYGDRDSVGWLQQRPSQGWGTVEQIRDPAYAARKFFEALRGVPGWMDMAPNDAAQAVQRSGYPEAYAKWEDEARSLAQKVGADLDAAGDAYGDGTDAAATTVDAVSNVLGCGGADLDKVGAGPIKGEWPEEQATICPDPTNGRGCVTPRTLDLINAIKASGLTYPSISCWDPHAWNPKSDHSRGRACDIAFSSGFPNDKQKAQGDAMAAWAIENAQDLGINYIIWQGRAWRSWTGAWEKYTGGGIYDVTSPSGGHYDHVHISMR